MCEQECTPLFLGKHVARVTLHQEVHCSYIDRREALDNKLAAITRIQAVDANRLAQKSSQYAKSVQICNAFMKLLLLCR